MAKSEQLILKSTFLLAEYSKNQKVPPTWHLLVLILYYKSFVWLEKP